MFSINKPKEAIFELTNSCNLRCKMCGIWEEIPKKLFSLGLLDEILKQKSLSDIHHTSLTGGEPFLITNLEDYYFLIKEYLPKSFINVSTNGYFTERILKFLENVDINKTSITISYDGIKSHDSIRRVKGSAGSLLKTVAEIKEKFPTLKMSLKLTATNENYNEIMDTAQQCKDLDVPFLFKTLEKLTCYQNRFPSEIDGPNYSKEIFDSIINQIRQLTDLNIPIIKRYANKLMKKYSGKNVSCNCSAKRLFINIDGNVFLCRKKEPIGNVYYRKLDEMWHSEQKRLVAQSMKECKGCDSLSFISS